MNGSLRFLRYPGAVLSWGAGWGFARLSRPDHGPHVLLVSSLLLLGAAALIFASFYAEEVGR